MKNLKSPLKIIFNVTGKVVRTINLMEFHKDEAKKLNDIAPQLLEATNELIASLMYLLKTNNPTSTSTIPAISPFYKDESCIDLLIENIKEIDEYVSLCQVSINNGKNTLDILKIKVLIMTVAAKLEKILVKLSYDHIVDEICIERKLSAYQSIVS